MGVEKERKSTLLLLNNGKKRLAACLLHNIDIAAVSECLCHLRAQYPMLSIQSSASKAQSSVSKAQLSILLKTFWRLRWFKAHILSCDGFVAFDS